MSNPLVFDHHPLRSSELPGSWSIVPIDVIAKDVSSGFPSGAHNSRGEGVPHLRPMNIDREGRFDLSSVKHLTGEIPKVVQKGDVLFNNTNSPELIGKTTVVPTEEPMGFSNHMTRIRLEDGLSASFSARQLHFLWMAGYFLHRCKNHVNQASIAAEPLAHTVPFALPPSREQERIADTLDELLTDLDAGVAALERVQTKLTHYRAAVLKAAVEGDLTADWRAQHPDTESAAELLPRILTERRRRWEEDQLRKFHEAGKEPTTNWKARYAEPRGTSSSELIKLPETWLWASVEQVSSVIVDCPHSTPKFIENGRPCIDTTCMKPGKLVRERVRTVSVTTYEERVSRLVPQAADIVFAREGTVGTAVAIPDDLEPCLGQRVMMMRPDECIVPSYFESSLNSVVFKHQYQPKMLGSTVNHLNVGDVKLFAVPLPPLAEQEAIVEAVEAQLSVIDHLEADIAAKLKSAQGLRQSILRHAFTGQLVPQDPNDEPASELLKRIATEREERARTAASARLATKTARKQAKPVAKKAERKRVNRLA